MGHETGSTWRFPIVDLWGLVFFAQPAYAPPILPVSVSSPPQEIMARPDRLFRLLTALRSLPAPVTAARLAAETEVSERTLYRDIDTLRAGGAQRCKMMSIS